MREILAFRCCSPARVTFADSTPENQTALYFSLMQAIKGSVPAAFQPDPVIEAYKKDVDRTLLYENLKLTTSERVKKMIAAARFAEVVRRSRVKPR